MVLLGEPYPEPAAPFESVRALLIKYKDRHPDKTAIYDLTQEKGVTWGELHDLANRVARFLHERGIAKGDRVALLSGENLEKLICWMGIWRLGAVVCPTNVEMNAVHMNRLLGHIEPKLILWHEGIDGPGLTSEIAVDKIMVAGWPAQGGAPGDELFAALAGISATPELDAENEADDLAAIHSTSGTTATPKSILSKHWAFWLNGFSSIDFIGLTADDKTLDYRSFGWNSPQILSLMPMLELGLTLHMARRFSRSRFFSWIKDHDITFAAGVPTVINMLLNETVGITADDIPSLRYMTCSTAPISPEQWQRFEDTYGVNLLPLYGFSEGGWVCGNRHYKRKPGTVGFPAKHQQFQIVDDEGAPSPPGVEGEVTVGGPQACIATISPEGEYEDHVGARLKTGDLAVMDEDGFVCVTGRSKDLIIRGGVNVAPLEIDHVLMKHPKVAEAAAVGRARSDLRRGDCLLRRRQARRRPQARRNQGPLRRIPSPLQNAQSVPLHRRAAQERPRQGAARRPPRAVDQGACRGVSKARLRYSGAA